MLPIYLLLKTAAYVAWCRIGLRRHRADLRSSGRDATFLALGLGVLRAGLGLGFGVGIWLGSSWVVVTLHDLGLRGGLAEALTYLAVYVPVRVVEWGIVGRIGLGRLVPSWIAGGIGVSLLCDVPMMIALGGLPLGRFMC